jgi:hypothetical protein
MKFQQEVIKIIGRQHFIANIGNESLKKEEIYLSFSGVRLSRNNTDVAERRHEKTSQ